MMHIHTFLENTLRRALGVAVMVAAVACENNNINPYDYNGNGGDDQTSQGSSTAFSTALAQYPAGAVVWSHDTTLTQSVEIAEGASLYIEPGVTVTCQADAPVPVELVVLGNLYCMGTPAQPVTFTSSEARPAAWGGIICGYGSSEAVLSYVNVCYAGATPTESSLSFQNKLYKTTIDGGVPAFHFCNTNGRFAISHCFFHDNYSDHIYTTGGQGVVYGNVLADNGNAADGCEAVNVKAGCLMDVAFNTVYNACSNAFKLSNQGTSETVPLTRVNVYNNTIVDCGWRRASNKKGGSIWVEKAVQATVVNNLLYDCRYGMKDNSKDGADMAHSRLTPNYYFASTAEGVEQMGPGTKDVLCYDTDVKSTGAGLLNPLFDLFGQNPLMNINCENDLAERGAPLPYDTAWRFTLRAGSPALQGAVTDVSRFFPDGLPFIGMKQVVFHRLADDQGYRFAAPVPASCFGAWGQGQ